MGLSCLSSYCWHPPLLFHHLSVPCFRSQSRVVLNGWHRIRCCTLRYELHLFSTRGCLKILTSLNTLKALPRWNWLKSSQKVDLNDVIFCVKVRVQRWECLSYCLLLICYINRNMALSELLYQGFKLTVPHYLLSSWFMFSIYEKEQKVTKNWILRPILFVLIYLPSSVVLVPHWSIVSPCENAIYTLLILKVLIVLVPHQQNHFSYRYSYETCSIRITEARFKRAVSYTSARFLTERFLCWGLWRAMEIFWKTSKLNITRIPVWMIRIQRANWNSGKFINHKPLLRSNKDYPRSK